MLNRYLAAYAALSHNRPWTVLGVVVGVGLLVTGVVLLTGQLRMSETDGEEWLLPREEMVERFDAVNFARAAVPEAAEETASSLARDTSDWRATTIVIYTSATGNMLTPEGLAAMRQVEETYFNHPDFTSLCQLQYIDGENQGCAAPMSLLLSELFSASPWDGDSPGYSLQDLQQEDIDSRLAADPVALRSMAAFLDKDFAKPCSELEEPVEGCTGLNIKSKYVRSKIFPGGLPLDDWLDKEDPFTNAQKSIISEFTAAVDKKLFALLGMTARPLATPLITQGRIGDVEVVWENQYLKDADFDTTVNGDFVWAVASLLAVFSYMAFHTRSLMIASLGMLSVVLSFTLALFTTKLIFQIAYMDMMSILVIFVTLGIGADDIFVFVDCFQQSEAVPDVCGSLLDRVTYTLNRSSKAIFVTSLTTMVAFMMTSISDLVNIQAFGIFAGMNIFYLFWLTVLLMPPTITIWSRKYSHLPCCVCHPSCPVPWMDKDRVAAKTNAQAQAMEARNLKSHMSLKRINMAPKDQDMESTGIKAARASEEDGDGQVMDPSESKRADSEGLRGLERFFNGRYIAIMQKIKYLVIVSFIALAGMGIFFALQLEPPADSEDFMPPYHMSTKFKKLLSPNTNIWLSSNADENEEVFLVWGIKGMDRSGRDKWDPTDRGTIDWDEEWQPFSESVQAHLMKTCDLVSSGTCKEDTIGCQVSDIPGDDTKWLVPHTLDNPEGDVTCWIELMNEWLSATQNKTLPLPPAEFEANLRTFHKAKPALRNLIGFVEVPEAPDGILTLKFYAQNFSSTFQAPRSSAVTRQVVEDWEAFTNRVNALAPDGPEAFMSSGYAFVWFYTQESLVVNAVMGLGLVFALAFIVINIATWNLIVSIVTTLTIAGIVVSVLGVGAKGMCNWEFGMAESIATVILIGFSMDYCLHIAGAYIESESHNRVERVRDAVTHLGVSVVAGAVTTVLSGLFLWGTVMVFFQKFAFLITFTVVMSFLWAVLFLPAVLMVIGPEGDFANWGHMFNMCLRRPYSTPVERLP